MTCFHLSSVMCDPLTNAVKFGIKCAGFVLMGFVSLCSEFYFLSLCELVHVLIDLRCQKCCYQVVKDQVLKEIVNY